MTEPLTERSARVAAARKLTRRAGRDAAGLFLAEGPQAVREALVAGAVVELFGTPAGLDRHAALAAPPPPPAARPRGPRAGSGVVLPGPGGSWWS